MAAARRVASPSAASLAAALLLAVSVSLAQEPSHAPATVEADPALDAAYLRGPYPRRPAGPIADDEGAALEFRYEAERTGLAVLLPPPRAFDLTAPAGRVFRVLALPADPFDGRVRLAVRGGRSGGEGIVLPGERMQFAVSGPFEAPPLLASDPDVTVTRGSWTSVQPSERRGVLTFRLAPSSGRSVDCRWRVREVDATSGAPLVESAWVATGAPAESPVRARLADLRFGHDVWLALGVLREAPTALHAALAATVTRTVLDRGSLVLVRVARWEGIRRFLPGEVETVEIAPELRDCRSRLLLDVVLTVKETDGPR